MAEEYEEVEGLPISQGRKVAVRGINYSVELVSFFPEDNLDVLHSYAVALLEEMKRRDKVGVD